MDKTQVTVPGLVSVILPTYNRARTLGRSIRSVLGQGYNNLELIVVDDGSSDDTRSVIDEFDDKRLIYVPLGKNQGASAARNHGLGLVRGEFVAFQDSDDEWLADKLQQQVSAARASGHETVAVFHMKVVYGRDEARVYGPGRVCCVPRLAGSPENRDFVKITHRENVMSPQTLLFSANLIEKIGPFDKLLVNSVDWDFSLRLVYQAKVVFIETPLVMTYIQDDSISTLRRNMTRSQLRILLKLRHRPDVDPVVLSDHFARIGLGIGRFGKPRMARRLLRNAVSLSPTRISSWAKLIANEVNGIAPRRK